MLYFSLHWSEELRVAPGIELTVDQERELTTLARSKLTSVRLAQRAQIVLLAAQGLQNKDIAEQLGIGRVQVARWRERYLESGLQGIERDLPRGAPPVKVDVAKLVELTTQSTPEAATHWSTRKMAAVLEVSPSTVMRHWQANGSEAASGARLQDLARSEIRRKARRHRGSVRVPARACARAVLRREEPGAGAGPHAAGPADEEGRAQTMTHDYKRNGTTTLFAALNVLNGQVIGQCQQRHTHAEWLKFLRKIDRETPKDKTLHLIADNYATHKHPVVQEWLAKHPRFNMHFTPTSASWLNMVERFFRDITVNRLAPRRVHQRARVDRCH
jgi:transposase